jgi:radical SAM protein with 4Fe4S-binding SPASM domain
MLPTCTTYHLGHEEELVEFFAHKGRPFYVRTVNRTGKVHKNGTYDMLGMTARQAIAFWQKSLEHTLEKNRQGTRMVETQTQYLLRNLLNLNSTYMCMRSPCGAATSQLVVSESGNIHVCDAGRSIDMLVLGNVMTHTYQDIITSDTARALRSVARETMPKCRTCTFSPYCQYCFVQAINVAGGPIPKVPLDYQCQIFITMIPYLFRKFLNPEDARILASWVTE